MSDATPRRPADRSLAHEALAILLLTLEEKVPGTLAVLTDPRTREAAVAALNARLREAMVELGHLPDEPGPPAA